MTREEKIEIVQLINHLRSAANEINVCILQINNFEKMIPKGICFNSELSFDNELEPLKSKLLEKKNYILNVIIPNLRTQLNS